MPRDEPSYSHLPIPTYEEAISSSRASSDQAFRGEPGHNDERQGLIANGTPSRTANGGYRPPTVESARSSYDSDGSHDTDRDEHELRRDMEEMEVDDGAQPRFSAAQRRALHLRSKIMARLSRSMNYVRLPRMPESVSRFRQHLPAWPERLKPSFPVIARLIALSVLVAGVYALLMLRVFGPDSIGMPGATYQPESLRAAIQDGVDKVSIEASLRQLSFDDHIAGTRGDFFLANWLRDKFDKSGIDSASTEDFYVYLNYPKENGRRVAIIEGEGSGWQAALEEERINPDLDQHQALTFHSLSRSGNVTGHLVYANYGARADFEYLARQGIQVKGAIVLMRYYGYAPDLALKVKAAELAGAVGALVYSDPEDDGFVRGPTWPDGPWRTADSVHRGSVGLLSWVLGDTMTPGWPSTKDSKRASTDRNAGLVNIPSLPLSWRDAKTLLTCLKDSGIRVPGNWIGGVPDIGRDWFTGNISSSPIINLENTQDEVQKQPIRNVLGAIHGAESPESHIYLGAHRDAFCFGSVPGLGTAILLEVVRLFGQLRQAGWRPRRTLVFANWDAGEVNLMGSTEHVEAQIDSIRRRAFAYLNVDSAITGRKFTAAGSPLFSRPLMRVLDRVADPVTNMTLRQLWSESGSQLQSLSASSDHVPFQALTGTSSIDFSFTSNNDNGAAPAYPRGSCYQTFRWMQEHGDPGFMYASTLAQVWALLALELADEPLLPFDFMNYAHSVVMYLEDLRTDIAAISKAEQPPKPHPPHPRDDAPEKQPTDKPFDHEANPDDGIPQLVNLTSLTTAAATLTANAARFNQWGVSWHDTLVQQNNIETEQQAIHRISHNARMSEFETHLLDLPGDFFVSSLPGAKRPRGSGGVPGREQYKHVLFGPGTWTSSRGGSAPGAGGAAGGLCCFPAVRDALEERDWERAQRWVEITAEVVNFAATKLTA